MNPTNRALTDAQRAEVARRYRAGETIDELARAFKCSTGPIRAAMKAHGVRARKFINFPGGGEYVNDRTYATLNRWHDTEEPL